MGGLLLTMIVVVMMHVLRVSRDLVHRSSSSYLASFPRHLQLGMDRVVMGGFLFVQLVGHVTSHMEAALGRSGRPLGMLWNFSPVRVVSLRFLLWKGTFSLRH